MIITKKWVTAGSTATLLAGGMFLGAPLASAAPGDAACLTASTQFNAALGAAGVDVTFVNQFEAATAAVVTAAANFEAAFVAGHHVVRIFLVMTGADLAFRWIRPEPRP